MSRATLLVGMVGGIMGTIALPIFIYHYLLFNDLSSISLQLYLLYDIYLTAIFNAYSAPSYYLFHYYYSLAVFALTNLLSLYFFVFEPAWSTFGIVSVMTGAFLFLHIFLISLGFFGIYKAAGRASGAATFIMGLIASPMILILYLLIYFLPVEVVPYVFTFPIRIIRPNIVFLFLAVVALIAFLLTSGITGIVVREDTGSPSVTLAAGILNIISSIVTILLFVSSILWAVAFYNTAQKYSDSQPAVPPYVPPSGPAPPPPYR
ncbi:MAG: hypothetical protein QW566_09005 [Candidatus Jordarchaeales archaeon]